MAGIALGSAIVGAATGIYSAVTSAQQGQKALDMQFSSGLLDTRTKAEMERALQKSNSDNTRIKILTDSVANIKSAQTSAIINATIQTRQIAKDTEKKNLVIASVGGGIIIIGALAVYKFA
jgi:hypothetical protein